MKKNQKSDCGNFKITSGNAHNGTVNISSPKTNEWDEVYVDGKNVGETGEAIPVAEGTEKIEIFWDDSNDQGPQTKVTPAGDKFTSKSTIDLT